MFILQDGMMICLCFQAFPEKLHKDYSVLDKYRQLKIIDREWPGGGSNTLTPLGHNDLVLPACKKRKGPSLSSIRLFGENTLKTHKICSFNTTHTQFLAWREAAIMYYYVSIAMSAHAQSVLACSAVCAQQALSNNYAPKFTHQSSLQAHVCYLLVSRLIPISLKITIQFYQLNQTTEGC